MVTITDSFFSPYIRLVQGVMLPYQWDVLNDKVEGAEKSHSIENIRIAAGLSQGEFEGMVFQDSDVAKWIEAVAYCLQDNNDSNGISESDDITGKNKTGNETLQALQSYADEAINLIAKAQCEDGYFNTYFQLTAPDKKFTNLNEAHELYCLGHFIEAAVAYYQATGKREILDVFCKYADLIDSLFGSAEGKSKGYPGHQEIELALARLFELTGEQRYLNLAKFFLGERGTEPNFFSAEWKARDGLSIWSRRKEPCPKEYSYSQAHKPVREQTEAVGHAVRAMYMYTAMAEVGRLTGDDSLLSACRTLFGDICKQLYVTGGIGQTNHGEAFTFAYDLPNEINYSETCASIGLIFFMRSMLKAEPRSAYADVMERALYNTVLASIGTDGKSYFYVNPMEVWPKASEHNPARHHVAAHRQKWHRCACCPPNAARLIASLRDYLYTVDSESNTVYFHLYAASELKAEMYTGTLEFSVQTEYPLTGEVSVEIKTAPSASPITLAIRIPQWLEGILPKFAVNGETVEVAVKNGYAHITRIFKAGDTISFAFDITPRYIRANTEVRANAGKVCLQRGPLVYCLEECDNSENLHSLIIKVNSEIIEKEYTIGGIPCVILSVKGYREKDSDEDIYTFKQKIHQSCELTFVPYHLWGNRNRGEMTVWAREILQDN